MPTSGATSRSTSGSSVRKVAPTTGPQNVPVPPTTAKTSMSTTRPKAKPFGATMNVKCPSSPPASPASAAPSISMASLYRAVAMPIVRAAGSSSRMASRAKPHFDPRSRQNT